MTKTCTKEGCTRPTHSNSLCQIHYDRVSHRQRHRDRSSRLIEQRARNRAGAILIDRHREEFERIYALQLEEARLEAETLLERTGQPHPRLRPGPRPDDETLEQRVRGDVARCIDCHRYHDANHRCPNCREK